MAKKETRKNENNLSVIPVNRLFFCPPERNACLFFTFAKPYIMESTAEKES